MLWIVMECDQAFLLIFSIMFNMMCLSLESIQKLSVQIMFLLIIVFCFYFFLFIFVLMFCVEEDREVSFELDISFLKSVSFFFINSPILPNKASSSCVPNNTWRFCFFFLEIMTIWVTFAWMWNQFDLHLINHGESLFLFIGSWVES